ncbi:unnamed protein product [Cylicocyclus nassatus]|uniref:Calponin-homology (CH) domain-containing protein n=1 Tax=Cylicocyclus nassatus TaxID=53992 RepID=A0AA36HGF2_CYLNA|nr:unnamed protein product [Cylicocyclus nassatus]
MSCHTRKRPTKESESPNECLVTRSCFVNLLSYNSVFITMEEDILPPLTPLDQYQETEGKLAASIRWLILRVYEQEKDVPDKLRHGAFRDERGHLQLDVAILTGLTNGSLYSQAAAKIFKEPQLVTQSHGAVLAALVDYGIDVVQSSDGGPVTENLLFAADNFNITAHLAMMDALMQAHLRNVITVNRVIDAVSRHTTVDESERPMDSVDALLFWINKVCLLVRDDVERSQIQLKGGNDGGMIPEMEDLYDEISDGQCLCTLVAWYRPREMEIEDICYNDQMSTAHCHYNLLLLQRFCHNCLPWNPFHFDIEDILYLHDSLQMNINVFLADLFEIFEPAPTANSAARSAHPPRVRNPFNSIHVTSTPGGAMPSRSVSMMSQDSLLTNRSHDSWQTNQRKPENWSANVTNFGRLVQPDGGSNGNQSPAGCSPYARSDSLPAASIRLALEEKRRDHEKRKALISTMTESERMEKGKAAFFAVMSRFDAANTMPSESTESPNAKMIRELDRKLTDLAQQVSFMNLSPDQQRMSRALSQPSVYQDAPQMAPASARAGYGTLPHNVNAQAVPNYAQPYSQQQDFYNYAQPQGHYAQPQQPPPGYAPDPYSSHPGSYMQQQSQQLNYPMMHQSAHAATGFSLHQPSTQPPQPNQLMSTAGMMSAQQQQQQQQLYQQQYAPYQGTPQLENQPPLEYESHEGASTFRLHSQDASSSRIDPPLEINRNLTNWGMTYQKGHTGRPQRRTWENQTFIKSEQDLVNQPELVPTIPSEDDQVQRQSPCPVGAGPRRVNFPSPPRDPSNNTNGAATAPPGPAFVISAYSPFYTLQAEQRRQAKRAALLAKTMKRKEEIESKVDQIEQRNAEKRLAEIAKREMAEQRKLEKELQRQKILDDYKRRKMEKEMGVESGSNSARRHEGNPRLSNVSRFQACRSQVGLISCLPKLHRNRIVV